METYHGRACIPKKGIQFFYDNDDNVFRMALTQLHVQYRTYWPLKALGLPKQFHSEENLKAVLADKDTNRCRTFIRELRAVSARDERLYNFVCESLPSDALEEIKSEISASTRAKQRERNKLGEKDIKAKEWTGIVQRRQRALASATEEEKQELLEHVLWLTS